jgi:hypothetical protein
MFDLGWASSLGFCKTLTVVVVFSFSCCFRLVFVLCSSCVRLVFVLFSSCFRLLFSNIFSVNAFLLLFGRHMVPLARPRFVGLSPPAMVVVDAVVRRPWQGTGVESATHEKEMAQLCEVRSVRLNERYLEHLGHFRAL